MSNKTINIPRKKPSSSELDSFVRGKPAAVATEPMKRLTFDIPASLHKRIRMDCLEQGIDMAVVIRRMLQERWPVTP
jgi:hypothetical protein